MRSMRIKRLIRFIAFMLIFVLLLTGVTNVMKTGDKRSISVVENFYRAPANSLDAVYIGASTCMKFWNSMLAWEQYGICVQPLATNSNPIWTNLDFIKEARKTQPDALYIVNINTLNKASEGVLRAVIDSFPFSFQKLRMIKHMCDYGEYSFEDRLEYYFRIIRYHTRWNELTPDDFTAQEISNNKGAEILLNEEDISDKYIITDEIGKLKQDIADSVTELLDYCDREQLKVLFVVVPQYKTESTVKSFNSIKAMIEDRGYTVLDLIKQPDEIGLDLTMDFNDNSHTNIHGSAKSTLYIADYLVKEYGFTDKREDPAYSSWKEAYESYSETIAPYLLDIEHIPFANKANMTVSEVSASRTDEGATVSWSPADGADGYLVYCRIKSTAAWIAVADTTELTCFVPPPEGRYRSYYTVVPYRDNNGTREYGSFIHDGVRVPE